MPIDPTELAKSIGALGSLDPERGLAPTLQQIADSAKQLFAADGAGLMLVDAEGQLRWASASDQTAQTVEVLLHVLRVHNEFVDYAGEAVERKVERYRRIRTDHALGR